MENKAQINCIPIAMAGLQALVASVDKGQELFCASRLHLMTLECFNFQAPGYFKYRTKPPLSHTFLVHMRDLSV